LNPIIDNFFEQEEIELIKTHIYDRFNKEEKYIENMQGRARMEISPLDLPLTMRKKLINYSFMFDKQCRMNTFTFVRYSNEYGVPILVPHMDRITPNEKIYNKLTLDYQLDSNTEWPIYVEDQEFVLKDNQALAINVTENVHWRGAKKFNDGEYVDMIFFHFSNIVEEKHRLTSDEQDRISKDYSIKHGEQLDKAIPGWRDWYEQG